MFTRKTLAFLRDLEANNNRDWHPEPPLLARIREAIVAEPRAWKSARDAKAFRDVFGELQGESLPG